MNTQKDLDSGPHEEGPQASSSDDLTRLSSQVSATISDTPIRDATLELGKARSETGAMVTTKETRIR